MLGKFPTDMIIPPLILKSSSDSAAGCEETMLSHAEDGSVAVIHMPECQPCPKRGKVKGGITIINWIYHPIV